jgi:hypothetical protein
MSEMRSGKTYDTLPVPSGMVRTLREMSTGYLSITLPVRCSKCGARQFLERKGQVCRLMQTDGSRCDGVIQ